MTSPIVIASRVPAIGRGRVPLLMASPDMTERACSLRGMDPS
jgi:hypothetical protein